MRTVLLVCNGTELQYFDEFLKASCDLPLRMCVFDVEKFPSSQTHATVRLTPDGRVSGSLGVEIWNKVSGFEAGIIGLEEVDLAWWLRCGKPARNRMGEGAELEFAQAEASGALRAVISAASWKWINSPDAIRKVEGNKLYQQAEAVKAGLRTPDTIVTNHPSSLIGLIGSRKKTLLKIISQQSVVGLDQYGIYSELFSQDEINGSPEAITFCPVYSQEYIEKKCEHRVMVIGEIVMACRIDSQASEISKVDWRHYDLDNVKHELVELPQNIVECLKRFMDRVDLRYGAIDLIETPDGSFVFLEVNPNGQWEWISHLTGMPIPKAVVNMLTSA